MSFSGKQKKKERKEKKKGGRKESESRGKSATIKLTEWKYLGN